MKGRVCSDSNYIANFLIECSLRMGFNFKEIGNYTFYVMVYPTE